jgi:hypothetical protein
LVIYSLKQRRLQFKNKDDVVVITVAVLLTSLLKLLTLIFLNVLIEKSAFTIVCVSATWRGSGLLFDDAIEVIKGNKLLERLNGV